MSILVVVTPLYTFIKTNRTVHHKGPVLLYANYTLSKKLSPSKLIYGRKK